MHGPYKGSRRGTLAAVCLCLLITFFPHSTMAKKQGTCLRAVQGEDASLFYRSLNDADLDFIVRGPWPWSDKEGVHQFIGRARDHIKGRVSLSQEQNVALWEAFVERIRHHTQGHMLSPKLRLSDGTVIFYSGEHSFDSNGSKEKFYFFFAFPPDGSMHYGTRSYSDLPQSPDFQWQHGNINLRRLK